MEAMIAALAAVVIPLDSADRVGLGVTEHACPAIAVFLVGAGVVHRRQDVFGVAAVTMPSPASPCRKKK